MPKTWDTEQELQLAMIMLNHHTGDFKNLDWKNIDPNILKAFGGNPSPNACQFEAIPKKDPKNENEDLDTPAPKAKGGKKRGGRATKRSIAKDNEGGEVKAEDDSDRALKRHQGASAKGKEVSFAESEEEANDSV
ncbi:hypothetical protein PG993_003113 [Apiospora rasikravindrae]|uniref:Uncharacterized protein n=1 Tax=Apiospora rasikravindrae TaxID=990691 RepID=A0ABR1TYS3_9PEZI